MIGKHSADRLTEDDVVDAVCSYLQSHGFTIKQRLTTRETGDDIVAERRNDRLFIEAKGATSARVGSTRFGRAFDSAQIHVHVAEAIFRAMQILSRPGDGHNLYAAVALPANPLHERKIASVTKILEEVGIAVFWVDGESNVTIRPAGRMT